MDSKEQPKQLKHHPAHLFIGSTNTALKHLVESLQQLFCSAQGCKQCYVCLQLVNKQHHNTLWLQPEKQYTLEQLTPIFEATTHELKYNEHFFIIIEQAELLNSFSSNKLLKIIEEPPIGYHFVLITDRPEDLLTTIRSRCLAHALENPVHEIKHTIVYQFFTSQQRPDPLNFMSALEKSGINEHQTATLLDALLVFWLEKNACASTNADYTKSKAIIDLIQLHYKQLPMPGGAKIFWRNLYLNFQNILY